MNIPILEGDLAIMLDIETLGTDPGSVIRTIGAVKFNHDKIIERFYTKINVNSSIAAGCHLQWDTLQWWMGQSSDALQEITADDGVSLAEALIEFDLFYTHHRERDSEILIKNNVTEIWGNGATFDNVLIEEAHRKLKVHIPWKFNVHRCYHTMRLLHPNVPFIRKGVHHNALDDAVSQAEHLIKLQKLYK